MSTAMQASVPSRVAVRSYQLVVMMLTLALAAVTALAVYLAVDSPAGPAAPPSGSGGGTEQVCFRPQVPC